MWFVEDPVFKEMNERPFNALLNELKHIEHNKDDKRMTIRKVIFSPPATIVLWEDDTKTVVKCDKHDEYHRATGLLLCIAKKYYGTKEFRKLMDKYIWSHEEDNAKREYDRKHTPPDKWFTDQQLRNMLP